jgi:hypothetical protein
VADDPQQPVGKGTPVDFGGGVTATLTATKTLDVDAKGPGETSGPAVAATIQVTNGSNQPFDLSTLAVTATYGASVPAVQTGAGPAEDFKGSVAPGSSATGVYVFRVPSADADSVVVQVQSGLKQKVPQFKV